MAIYHFHVGHISRGKGASAVAAAAYRAGEALKSESYGEKYDYTRKGGVVFSEILLPSRAPPEYSDREILWNAVEKIERRKDAQLAYSFDIALQNEFTMEENKSIVKEYLLENFVSRGMIVDYAIHDPEKNGNSNPHFHVMCPIRPLNDDGLWGTKQRREYLFDENNQPILDEAGHQKFNAVPTTNWGSPDSLEEWRKAWAEICNREFERKGLDCRIDHRSYKKQGIDQLPTIHEGPAVREMEKRGLRTDKGDWNRYIRDLNAKIKTLLVRIQALLAALSGQPKEKTIADLLNEYYDRRNAGAYSKKAKVNNLKEYAKIFAMLQSKGIATLSDLENYVSATREKMTKHNRSVGEKTDRIKAIDELIHLMEDHKKLKPIIDVIPPKGGFGRNHERYMQEHESEIRQFHAVARKLEAAQKKGKVLNPDEWQREKAELQKERAAESAEANALYQELKSFYSIMSKINAAKIKREYQKETER